MNEPQTQTIDPIHVMEDETLVSNLILADRDHNVEDFSKYRKEIMYRLRCGQPLVNWTKPFRREE